jgi:hypothetical protein
VCPDCSVLPPPATIYRTRDRQHSPGIAGTIP